MSNAHFFRGAEAFYNASPAIPLTGGRTSTSESFTVVSSQVPSNALNFTMGFNRSVVFNRAGDGTTNIDFGYLTASTYARVTNALSGLGAAHTYPFAIPDVVFPNASSSSAFFYQWSSQGNLSATLRRYRMPNGDV